METPTSLPSQAQKSEAMSQGGGDQPGASKND